MNKTCRPCPSSCGALTLVERQPATAMQGSAARRKSRMRTIVRDCATRVVGHVARRTEGGTNRRWKRRQPLFSADAPLTHRPLHARPPHRRGAAHHWFRDLVRLDAEYHVDAP